MHCTNCGRELTGTANFCSSCGKPVSETTPAGEAPGRKKKRIPLWAFIAGGAALLVAAILLVVLLVIVPASSSGADNSRLLTKAQQLFDDGEYREAVIAFEEYINIEPKDPRGYIGLADVYIELGNEAAALSVLTDGYERADGSAQIERCIDRLRDDTVAAATSAPAMPAPFSGTNDFATPEKTTTPAPAMPAPAAVPAQTTGDWAQVYADYLNGGVYFDTSNPYDDSDYADEVGYICIALYDIDENGIPELLFLDNYNWRYIEILTLRDGALMDVGCVPSDGATMFITGVGSFYSYGYPATGHMSVEYYNYSDGMLTWLVDKSFVLCSELDSYGNDVDVVYAYPPSSDPYQYGYHEWSDVRIADDFDEWRPNGLESGMPISWTAISSDYTLPNETAESLKALYSLM